jgi:WD40 repeat protein
VNRGGGRDADDCFGFSADNDLSAANTTTKKLFSEEEDDYASSVLFNAGIPSDDPAWFDIESEAFNYGTGMGVCLNMVRLHSAVISLSFHPSGEILAMASGNTLHLWDYNAEKRKKIQKELDAATAASVGMGFHPNGAAIGLESPSPSRESEARILNRSETSVFPRTPMIDFQHNTPLRCVHFPPCGTVIIVGGVNPASANEGLPSARDPRRRGGMSGGGMSFYLRMFDFNLDTLLNPTSVVGEGRALQRGGRINDEGDLEHDFTIDKDVLCNVSSFLSCFTSLCVVVLRNVSHKLLTLHFKATENYPTSVTVQRWRV